MSGNLRLNGATSGYSELAAPDVAGDQTFTFPSTGGTLAIASTNSGGQPVPGYQQGTWTPSIQPATAGNSSFTPNTNGANGGAFARIGNLVKLTGNVTGTFVLGTGTGQMHISGFPYLNAAGPQNGGFGGLVFCYVAGVGARAGAVVSGAIIPLSQDYAAVYERQVGASQDTGEAAVPASNIATGVNAVNIHFTAVFVTDNTDWTPINGATVS